MDQVKGLPRTTGEVLDWLRSLGLSVSATQIANDTRDGFLPEREPQAAESGRGRSATWEPWMVRRAERLYRLRKRKDASGQSLVYGDTLRALLFIRDGWGWTNSVRDLCLRGFEKSVAATLAPIRRYAKGPLDHEKVEYVRQSHDVALSPAERHAVGMLTSGEPLAGASLYRVFQASQELGLVAFPDRFVKMFSAIGVSDSASLAEFMGRSLRFSAPTLRSMIEGITDDDARIALPTLLMNFVRPIRAHIHRAAIAENQRAQCTSLFSAFGQTQRSVEKAFREGDAPKRITPAQALALFLGIGVLGDVLFRYVDNLANVAFNFAKSAGLTPPSDEKKLLPFAFDVIKQAFFRKPPSSDSTTST